MKQRLRWLDCAKGIGMICVIIGHIGISQFGAILYAFHLPLFFVLAGYSFYPANISFRSFVLKKTKRMLIPYFSLGGVLVGYYMLRRFLLFGERDIGVYWGLIRDLFLQRRFLSIWFIAALFISLLIFYLINRMTGYRFVATVLVSAAAGISGFVYTLNNGEPLYWNLDIAVEALLFLSMGYAIKGTHLIEKICLWTTKKRVIVALFCGAVTVVFSMKNYQLTAQQFDFFQGTIGIWYLALVAAISGVMCVMIISTLLKSKLLEYIGRESMVFLALHQSVFVTGLIEISETFGILNADVLPVRILRLVFVFVITVAGCSAVDMLLSKTKAKACIGK